MVMAVQAGLLRIAAVVYTVANLILAYRGARTASAAGPPERGRRKQQRTPATARRWHSVRCRTAFRNPS